jgi:hypothetical protein
MINYCILEINERLYRRMLNKRIFEKLISRENDILIIERKMREWENKQKEFNDRMDKGEALENEVLWYIMEILSIYKIQSFDIIKREMKINRNEKVFWIQ